MILMDNLVAALTVSLIGMLVTIVLLGALGAIFHLIGRLEINSSTQRKEDEPYVVAAAYYYLSYSGSRRSSVAPKQSGQA